MYIYISTYIRRWSLEGPNINFFFRGTVDCTVYCNVQDLSWTNWPSWGPKSTLWSSLSPILALLQKYAFRLHESTIVDPNQCLWATVCGEMTL